MRARLPLMVMALWWGSLTTIGFLVVPMLFAHLPMPAMAGNMAARLFSAQTWVSVVCGLLLLMQARSPDDEPRQGGAPAGELMAWVVPAMLLALLSEFAVAPHIVARDNLRLWHSVGTVFYGLQWLIVGALLWRQAKPGR